MSDSPGARYAPIVVEGVSKRYQLASDNRLLKLGRRLFPKLVPPPPELDFWALRDVGFRCEPGEALGVIGRNGAGKSTLLKVLCGVTTPTSGRVSIQGRVAPLIEVGAGFHPELTGRENVVLNAAILGMPRKEALAKYDAIVEFSGLARFMDTPVKRYSSGMTARLGFTLAVFLEPDALLVDEVLSVGDLGFVLKSYRKIEEIRKKGVPVILVSHNLQLIRNFCTRAIWLHDGQVRAQGAPAEVCAAYTRHALDTVAGELALTAGDSYRVQSDPTVSIDRVRFLDRDGAEHRSHVDDLGRRAGVVLDVWTLKQRISLAGVALEGGQSQNAHDDRCQAQEGAGQRHDQMEGQAPDRYPVMKIRLLQAFAAAPPKRKGVLEDAGVGQDARHQR